MLIDQVKNKWVGFKSLKSWMDDHQGVPYGLWELGWNIDNWLLPLLSLNEGWVGIRGHNLTVGIFSGYSRFSSLIKIDSELIISGCKVLYSRILRGL